MVPGSNIPAMFLIITYSPGLFDKMIIAGAASINRARREIERVGGVEVLWSQWFLAYLPGTSSRF